MTSSSPSFQLKAAVRSPKDERVNQLRRKGYLPGVLYGRGITNQPLALEYTPFEKTYKAAGVSSLIDLSIGEGQPVKVLIHEIARDPVSGKLQHVDFYQVNMTEKITAEVRLKFTGESLAVKELQGVLVKKMDHVKVECLPSDLIHEITVPIDSLKTFNDFVYIRDLLLPQGLKIVGDQNDIVVTVIPPRKEEEVVAPETGDVGKIKVVGKEEKEAEAAEAKARDEKSAKGGSASGGKGEEKKEKKEKK